ncbi:DUF2306 domain-containing protein [Paenibacillus whitsoniae]|uniref:DUF2306 domain-containing protein n=1 Tax=Paenibacillus whitsoniae TaxID=2496558 RepID=A0A430J6J6_9BACL|nr:DUF2306 domain-containing protein [Paenibacillus whitsoniae]RTE04372.1 DUF2306 domain-containing protein [Paenibacillus whitsoniae]
MNRKLTLTAVCIILAVAAVAIFPYLSLNPDSSRTSLTPNFPLHYPLLVLHIATALLALLSGLVQLSAHYRAKYPKRHRVLGRVYVISIFISGLLGLVLAFYAETYTKALAFLALSLLWLWTTWQGYRYAVRGNLVQHRRWMVRSYAITLVAITARLVVPLCILFYLIFHGFHLPEGGRERMVAEILNVNIWLGLLINVIIVEWGFVHRSGDIYDRKSDGK